jgi:tetratricopeptide (TPR) repeat protein/TolB-like protein
VRALPFVVALTVGFAPAAAAQLAAPQAPSQRLLVLPFQASAADSAGSIALADVVRDRVTALTKNKVLVVPKAKLCEALKASGFPCDGLLDDQQAKQLARFLQVHAYVTGSFVKSGSTLKADAHLIDIASSGMSGTFTISDANPGTIAALGDLIAQRVATIVRISEPIRNCNEERKKGQFPRARNEAQKALTQDPNSTGAWLCIATIYEAQRMPIDSVIAASERALKGDSLNGTALENIFRGYQQKGDTLKALDAVIKQLRGEPRNTSKRLGVAQLLRQMKLFQRAVDLLDEGLKVSPGDAQLLELQLTICNEAGMYSCSSRVFVHKAQHDTALLADTTFLKPAIGAAQQASDTAALDLFTREAVKRFPSNLSFIKARAGAFEMAGRGDSALAYYKKALAPQPNDAPTSLQIAKLIVDAAVWDTTKTDSVAMRTRRTALAQKIDSAKPYLRPGLTSADSMQRLAAAVTMLTAGSKLAQAAAYDRAYPWLDTLLQVVAPKSPADTAGPKQQVRINGSFWYGLSSVLTLNRPYQEMTKAKGGTRCPMAREVFDRLTRTKAALQLGRRVHPPTADQMLGFVAQYEKAKPSVQNAFKCSPPLS